MAMQELPSETSSRIQGTHVRRLSSIRLIGIALLLLAATLPLLGSQFYTRLAVEALLLGMLALSIDVLLGYVGLLSLGQAAYFGLGAYLAAILLVDHTPNFWLVLVCVAGVTTAVSMAFGAIALRTTGVYFALVTFGFGEVLYKIVSHTDALGGSDGLLGIPVASLGIALPGLTLQNDVVLFYFVLALFALVYAIVDRILDTPFGLVLRAVHENETRVPYLSFNTYAYKLVAYVLAANLAALAGMIYPILRGFVAPGLFSFETSITAVVMALVGGLGTLVGAFAGGAAITFLESVVSTITRHHLIVIGVIFVGCVIYFPQGLVGTLRQRMDQWRQRHDA